MLSTRQRAVYLGAGSAAAASLVWLRYAESASSTRRFLRTAGHGTWDAINSFNRTLMKVRERVVEIDRMVCELVRVGNEQKDRAAAVFSDTLGRFEETTAVIQRNVTQSSNEIATLIKDIRAAVGQSVSPKSSQAA